MAEEITREVDLNMQHCTLAEFCDLIKDMIQMGEFQQNILGLGKSGIGKTESIENAICKPLGIGLIEMRLGSFSETDLTGFPVPKDDPITGKPMMRFADVSMLPHVGRDPEVGILLLDEFTIAKEAVQGAALQLTDKSRSIGEYKLPPKWIVVAIGNGPSDGGYYRALEYVTLARFLSFRIDATFDDWKAWALQNDIHPAVLGFIEQYPQGAAAALHKMGGEDDEYPEKGANPRCWVKLSTILKKKEQMVGHMLDTRQATIYAGAAVGADLAVPFATYYEYQKNLIKKEDILSGKALELNLREYKSETLYMTCATLAMGVADIMKKNEKAIRAGDDITPEDTVKVENALKFAAKLAKESAKDIASGVLESMSQASELFTIHVTSLVALDKYETFWELNKELGGISSVNSMLSRSK